MRDPLPGAQEWADALDLTRRGREWVGPCPLCGGDDRFHVRDSGGRAAVGCRGCIDGQSESERAERFGEVLRAAFPGRTGATARSPAKVPRSTPRPVNGREAARRAIAGRLWAAMVPADDTPARAYLAGRSVWPPGGIGPDLPASVRWLPRGAVRSDAAADWYDVPAHSAGAIVYSLPATQRRNDSSDRPRRPGRGRAAARPPMAAHLRPKEGRGVRGGRGGRRSPSDRRGRSRRARGGVALSRRGNMVGGRQRCNALLAPAILDTGRRVVIEADPDGPGRNAALKLDKAIGGRAEISWNRGGDPADAWTDTLLERAAIMEYDGGLPRDESEQRVWALAIERR